MQGPRRASIRHLIGPALAGSLLAASPPGVATADEPFASDLPRCAGVSRGTIAEGRVVSPWRVELDAEGIVAGHRITLRHAGIDSELGTGPRGFSLRPGPQRLLIGERSDEGTELTMIDIGHACRLWARRLDRLAYPSGRPGDVRSLRLSMHRPETHRFEGDLALDVESGATGGIIDGVCITECEPTDGDISLAAYEPAGAPRPVPSFPAGGWPQDKKLRYRWGQGAAPPAWASGPLQSAGADADGTSAARSPRFLYRSDAGNEVSYSGSFPTYCSRSGIACAARRMPSYWGVWLRPHGTDLAWGTLRWCQKQAVDGCFDIRRVALHELGHISGLDHPSNAGFTLTAHETVMHAITPARPRPGSARHAFGRCDVATLQELYDTPDNKTGISTCNDLATELRLTADRSAIDPGAAVKLTAVLVVADRSGYRELAGNPLNGRSVKLKWRRADSGDAWNTAWMKSLYASGRYELTIAPGSTWEFKATFPAPGDEGLRYSRSGIVKVRVRR